MNVCFSYKNFSNSHQKSGLPTVLVIEGDMEIQRAWVTGPGPTAGEACGWDRSPGLCPFHSHTNSYSPGHRQAQQPHVTEERVWRPRAFSPQGHAENQWDLPFKKIFVIKHTWQKNVPFYSGQFSGIKYTLKVVQPTLLFSSNLFHYPKETLYSLRSLSLTCCPQFLIANNLLSVAYSESEKMKVLVALLCLTPTRLPCQWNSPGMTTGVGCHFLLQGIFPTQGSNSDLPHCRQIHYCLNHLFSEHYIKVESYDLGPFITSAQLHSSHTLVK